MSDVSARQGDTAATIQSWLALHISQIRGIDPGEVDVHRPFSHYGLGSADAAMLAADLEVWLQQPVEPTLVWDHPSIAAAASALAAAPSRRA
jgi:hypothetical protein